MRVVLPVPTLGELPENREKSEETKARISGSTKDVNLTMYLFPGATRFKTEKILKHRFEN